MYFEKLYMMEVIKIDLDIIGEFICDYNFKDMVVFRDTTGCAHVITADDFRKLCRLKPRKQNNKHVA